MNMGFKTPLGGNPVQVEFGVDLLLLIWPDCLSEGFLAEIPQGKLVLKPTMCRHWSALSGRLKRDVSPQLELDASAPSGHLRVVRSAPTTEVIRSAAVVRTRVLRRTRRITSWRNLCHSRHQHSLASYDIWYITRYISYFLRNFEYQGETSLNRVFFSIHYMESKEVGF